MEDDQLRDVSFAHAVNRLDSRHQSLNGSISELSRDMQSWVSMLESLLDRQKASQLPAPNLPGQNVEQRDNTDAPVTPQQTTLVDKLQQASDTKMQHLFSQYPQISETFKPVEQLLANITKAQSLNNGPNSWSNYQYQTNPVFPYQQENTGIQKDVSQTQTRIATNSFPQTAQSNQFGDTNSDIAKALQNFNQLQGNLPGNEGERSGYAAANPTRSPFAGFFWGPTQMRQPAWRESDQYGQPTANKGSFDVAQFLRATEKPVRPWPTPKPFNYDMDTLDQIRQRALEQRLLENELRKERQPIKQEPVLPKQPNLVKGGNVGAREATPFPAIKIAPFSGNAPAQKARLHPWPFALKIKVIPPDGGNYIMRIKGPLDSLAPKVSSAQSRSKGIFPQKFAANYLSMKPRYLAPVNRNYKPQTITGSVNNPTVYLKVPRSHKKFIELTTSFPNNKWKSAAAANSQRKSNVVSMKLPFNVSLATVLKNIYESMFANYLNKKPSEVMRAAAVGRPEGNALIPRTSNLFGQVAYGSYGSKRTAVFPKQVPRRVLQSYINVPNPAIKAFYTPKRENGPFEQKGNVIFRPAIARSVKSMHDFTNGAPFMKMTSLGSHGVQQNVNGRLNARRGYLNLRQGISQPYGKFDWKKIYEKLRSVSSRGHSNRLQPNRGTVANYFAHLNPKKDTIQKKNEFPESIRVRLYPGVGLNMQRFASKLIPKSNRANTRGKSNKPSYFARLEIQKPVQSSKLTNGKDSTTASKWQNTFQTAPQFENVLKSQIKQKDVLLQQRHQLPLVFPYQKRVSPVTTFALAYPQGPPSLHQRKANWQFTPRHISKKPGNRLSTLGASTLKFGQMKIPYKYLKDPITIGPNLKLVPVLNEGVEGRAASLRAGASTYSLPRIQSMTSAKRFLPNKPVDKQHSDYASQIETLRNLQINSQRTQLGPRAIPKRGLPVNHPHAFAQGRPVVRGPPLMDRLRHGLPDLIVKGFQKKLGADLLKNDYENAKIAPERLVKAQKVDVPGENAVSTSHTNVDNGPIVLTEKAQTRSTLMPVKSKNEKEKELIKESSRILSQFLKETAPADTARWEKRDSGAATDSQLSEAEIVSRSTIPEGNGFQAADESLARKRKHYLNNRLIRLKRKGGAGLARIGKRRTLRRSRRLR